MIKLQFVLGAGLSSRLIAWWGNGYGGYSHVDAGLPDGTWLGARSDAVGGKPPGVQIRPDAYETWAKRTVVTLNTTAAEAAQWEAFLRRQVGLQYDKTDIIGLITGKPIGTRGAWICSALQTDALQVIGKLPTLPVPPQQVTPNSLLLMCSAIGGQMAAN